MQGGFDVKRTDSHSFFEWSHEDENALRSTPCRHERTSDQIHAFGETGNEAELMDTDASSAVVQLMIVGLKTPENLGSILRICACFDVLRVHHVGLSSWSTVGGAASSAGSKGSGTMSLSSRELATLQRVAVGCETLVATRQWSMQQMNAFLDLHRTVVPAPQGGAVLFSVGSSCAPPPSPFGGGGRLPLVAVETAKGAVPLPSFKFPPRCIIVAGAEGSGVDVKLLRRLQPGFDAIVYIPMPGGHKSLNVAEAVSCAVYEYRRQWPGGGVRSNHGNLLQCGGSSASGV